MSIFVISFSDSSLHSPSFDISVPQHVPYKLDDTASLLPGRDYSSCSPLPVSFDYSSSRGNLEVCPRMYHGLDKWLLIGSRAEGKIGGSWKTVMKVYCICSTIRFDNGLIAGTQSRQTLAMFINARRELAFVALKGIMHTDCFTQGRWAKIDGTFRTI